ncbi:hypothetical protein [Lujinxingia litoralis]|uniref:hypothetical protein n=1 Tax=Lujinxingia litoralis TaxID=2211119 RepID=UPI001314F7EF|nr:hypothetical protein [Lujinxingia litoralis]
MNLRLRASILAMLLMVAVVGCRKSERTPREGTPEERSSERSPEASVEAEAREAFGLPLPPDYLDRIEISEIFVTVNTRMTLEELEAFFRSRLVDYEYVKTAGRVRVVPLRPHSPRVEMVRLAGRGKQVVVDYHAAPDVAGAERVEKQSLAAMATEEPELKAALKKSSAGPSRLGERAEWLSALRGKPVELRTADGQLLAPGAIWGEPYTPPPGTPLYGEQNRENFGRPFGDWRMH